MLWEVFMLEGFKKFIMRGNVIDLAVGVIIGGAFGTIVSSLVGDVITPLIGALVSAPDFSNIKFLADANGKGGVLIGKFINAIINFLLVAFAVYFFIVTPLNKLQEMTKKEEPAAAPALTKDQELLTEIRELLKK
jgi:large conductance mechanosensitive channel